MGSVSPREDSFDFLVCCGVLRLFDWDYVREEFLTMRTSFIEKIDPRNLEKLTFFEKCFV